MVINFFVNNFPQLGKYKRYIRALISHLSSTKESYSQQAEDLIFLEFFEKNKLSKENTLYVDVGSNHPSDISNTYLLYRNGYKGILIDANKELCKLCEKFRPRDIILNIGAGNEAGVMDFYISKTPVLSSFDNLNKIHNRLLYQNYKVPVMRIEDAIKNFEFEYINLLSIDVEGWSYETLEGCEGFLNRTILICIEYEHSNQKLLFEKLLLKYFFEEIFDNKCNVIYQNTCLIPKRFL